MDDRDDHPVPRDQPRQPGIVEATGEFWSAPLPTPADFRGYEDVLPGAADRILGLVEREQTRRISKERSEAQRSLLGLFLGFTLSAMSVGGGVWAMYLGRDVSFSLGLSGLGLFGIILGTILRWRSTPPGTRVTDE